MLQVAKYVPQCSCVLVKIICLLSPLEMRERRFSDILVYGLIRSSTVTAAKALMLVDTVLELIPTRKTIKKKQFRFKIQPYIQYLVCMAAKIHLLSKQSITLCSLHMS